MSKNKKLKHKTYNLKTKKSKKIKSQNLQLQAQS